MTSYDLRRIAQDSMADLRTVKKAYAGGLRGLVYARIAQSAERLGLPRPPEAPAKPTTSA